MSVSTRTRTTLGLRGVALALATAALAVLAFATAASADPTTHDIVVHDLRVTQSTTQAGAHPDVGIFFRFCGPGVQIATATKAGPADNVVLHLAADPGPAPGGGGARLVATVRGAQGPPT